MLNIDRETIRDILDKARQFQVKEEESFPDTNDEMDALYVLEDHEEDAVYQEVVQFIDDLRPDQQATLVALMYIGRGDFTQDEWEQAYKLAREEQTERTGEYLLSRPMVADDIERAMDLLGCTMD